MMHRMIRVIATQMRQPAAAAAGAPTAALSSAGTRAITRGAAGINGSVPCLGGLSSSSIRRSSTGGGGIATEWEGERQSGSGEDELQRSLSPDEVLKVGVRTQEMWKDHVALTTEFPEASLPPGGNDASVSPDAVRRKRLVYRSKQRGWLEVDLLLGTWAEKNVPGLSSSEMDSYEDILNLETVDIFNFVTGNAEPPSFVDTLMLARLQAYVKSNPLGQSPDSYASAKRDNNLT